MCCCNTLTHRCRFSGASIEYWFRCMDLDGDGVLSMYELEFFYDEQCLKLEAMAIEPLPFEDCLCQMLDLVKPEVEGQDMNILEAPHPVSPTHRNTHTLTGNSKISNSMDPFSCLVGCFHRVTGEKLLLKLSIYLVR